jgi:hypothetical protein
VAMYPVPFLTGVLLPIGVGGGDSASLEWFLWNVGVGRPIDAALLKSVKDLEVPILRNGPGLSVLLFKSADLRGFRERMSSEGRRDLFSGLVGEAGGSVCLGVVGLAPSPSSSFLRCFLAGHMYSMILSPTLVSSCKRIGCSNTSKFS